MVVYRGCPCSPESHAKQSQEALGDPDGDCHKSDHGSIHRNAPQPVKRSPLWCCAHDKQSVNPFSSADVAQQVPALTIAECVK